MLDIIRAVMENGSVDKLQGNSENDNNTKGLKRTNLVLLKFLNILPKKGYIKVLWSLLNPQRCQGHKQKENICSG